MCVHVCVQVCECGQVKNVYVRAHMRERVCVHTRVCVCVHVSIHVNVCAGACVCVPVLRCPAFYPLIMLLPPAGLYIISLALSSQ